MILVVEINTRFILYFVKCKVKIFVLFKNIFNAEVTNLTDVIHFTAGHSW